MAISLSRIIKKAASSVIPLANRETPHRKYISALLMTSTTISTGNSITNVFQRTSIPTHHLFSTLAEKESNCDDTFITVIESVIDCAEEKLRKFPETPREFPFKIEDNACEPTSIKLTREYQDEKIKITVQQHDYQYIDKEKDQYVSLSGNVSNKSGLRILTFGITAGRFSSRNKPSKHRPACVMADDATFNINSLNPNPSVYSNHSDRSFSKLDENLQKYYRTYLEVRGIEPSIGKFLYEYIDNKRHKKYTRWLKNLKKFVDN